MINLSQIPSQTIISHKLDGHFARIFTIPDIHGEVNKLIKVIDHLEENLNFGQEGDLLIFLGDLLDRGPNSKGVLDLVIHLTRKYPGMVYAIRGNHEEFAIASTTDVTTMLLWLREGNGGKSTLASYPDLKITDEHMSFLKKLPFSIETDKFFFSHAPVPRELKRKGEFKRFDNYRFGYKGGGYTSDELSWTKVGPECEKKGAMMDAHEGPISECGSGTNHLVGLCGHIHRGEGYHEIRKFRNYVMLDTGCGCYEDSPLSLYECISGKAEYFF